MRNAFVFAAMVLVIVGCVYVYSAGALDGSSSEFKGSGWKVPSFGRGQSPVLWTQDEEYDFLPAFRQRGRAAAREAEAAYRNLERFYYTDEECKGSGSCSGYYHR